MTLARTLAALGIERLRIPVVLLFGCALACSGPGDADGGSGRADGGPARDAGGSDASAHRDATIADATIADAASSDASAPVCPGGFGGPPATSEPPIPGTWTLALQDDFLSSTLDDATWKVGGHWAGFTGIAANDPKTISLDCGYLVFQAEHRTEEFAGETRDYAAGEITTFKRFRQLYGYFEARIRYDGVRGMWPAFWLMPDRGNYGNVDADRMAYLRFDLSGEPRTSVDEATLTLHVASSGAGTADVLLARVRDDSWSESTITWNARPAIDPLFLQMIYGPGWSGGETASFDVTDYVNRELAGDRVASFALFDTFMRQTEVELASRESASTGDRPMLTLSGGSEPIVASADATVAAGSNADTNLGSADVIALDDEWGDGSSTYDGGMEIDIMEALGTWGSERNAHTVHWDGYGADHQSASSGRLDLEPTDDGFHTYGVSWQPGVLRFFVDGRMTWAWESPRVGSVPAYILLSLQVGGWADDLGDNTVPDDAALPGRMIVDYVRVWSGSPS